MVALAVAGLVACLLVVAVAWPDWPDRPTAPAVGLDLGIVAAFTAFAVTVALRGPRWLGVPASLALLAYGWLGTWAYGFLWVPGAAALLGCLAPRRPFSDGRGPAS